MSSLRPSHPSSKLRSSQCCLPITSLLLPTPSCVSSLVPQVLLNICLWLRIELCCFLNLGTRFSTHPCCISPLEIFKRHNGQGRQEESSEGLRGTLPLMCEICPVNWGGWGGQAAEAIMHNKTQFRTFLVVQWL